MPKKIVGKCFICKKEVTRHDLSFIAEGQTGPAAYYFASWPGSGVCCASHPGVFAEYKKELKKGN